MNEVSVIVGFRPVDFMDEKAQKKVEGYTLFYTQEANPDSGIIGSEAGKVFINSQQVLYVPAVGDQVIFRYNKYGKVGAIEVI